MGGLLALVLVGLWSSIAQAQQPEVFLQLGHSGLVFDVAFSPNGKTVLSGSSDKTLKLWDVQSGRLIRTFEGHSDGVEAVAFSPDGKTALSGSWDETIVEAVAFSPDGKTALSGSWDETMKLWEVNTGSPDGKTALSDSDDGTIRLWNLQTGEEIAKMVVFEDGEWVTLTSQGYYVASENGNKYINVRIGNQVTGVKVEQYRAQFNDPEMVKILLEPSKE
ncbi:MAG: hypothetical protein B6247_30995 [Candidatus Parabeggiatoa sp. nov. 2]|nr:MAG: hypothetical protein B6247_30995 [Beggiatoa sp. 4572_84]